MIYDFDAAVDRGATASSKWDGRRERFGTDDLLPMWVADMDFPSPAPVVEALVRRAQHGVFGYTLRPDSYYEAIVGWFARRHGLALEREWIAYSPGVVPALHILVQTFTDPGDRVVIQPPVYHPFMNVIRAHGREIASNPLVPADGRYQIDFDGLDDALKGSRLLILCSPHNPVGRVWTRAELERLGELCLRRGVLVIADEIHCDLVFDGHRHVPFASLGPELAQISFTCVAPSKTFNVAGLYTACIVIPDAAKRERYEAAVRDLSIGGANPFGAAALEAAYRHGDEWLEQLLVYLDGNARLVESHIRERIPEIRVRRPEGTYLAWLDCRGLGLTPERLDDWMRREARVGMDEGYKFGAGGEGFLRFNFGCPRPLVREALARLERAAAALRRERQAAPERPGRK